MDRLKTFLKYVLWGIGLIILSEIISTVGLNSDYINMERKNEISQINVYQAQANVSNGRIRGIVTNEGEEELNGKYIEFNFYSERDVFIGRRYVYIPENVAKGQSEPFELLFKANNVSYYSINIVEEKKNQELDIIPRDKISPEVWFVTGLLALMFI